MTEVFNEQKEIVELKEELSALAENCTQNFDAFKEILTGYQKHITVLYQNIDYLKEKLEGGNELIYPR